MSGYTWKRDNDGNAHLENDILLAYTRGQLAADAVLVVQQHCAKCSLCTQKCAEYTRLGTTLQQNLTYVMPAYPSIVDMLGSALDSPAAASAALHQRQENKRYIHKLRARIYGGKGRRLMPEVGVLPLVASVSLMLLLVLMIYTLSSHMGILARTFSGNNRAATPSNLSTGVSALPTATQTPTPTNTVSTSTPGTTVGVTPTGTTTQAGTTKPVIWLCSTNADLSQSRLRICGKNFKIDGKVIVLEVLPGSGHRWVMITTADAHGNINAAWTIPSCRSVPAWVFAFDITRGLATQLVPVNVSPGWCRSLNVRPGGH